MVTDSEKDPAVVLAYLVGRPVSKSELHQAFGLTRAAYYRALSEGRLITADNLIRVAKYFHLNPIDLQVRYGLVSATDVAVEDHLFSDRDQQGGSDETKPEPGVS